MMEFVIASGVVTTVVLKVNEVIVNKRLERFGYVRPKKKSSSLLIKVLGLASNFIPILNLALALSITFSNLYLGDEKFIEAANKKGSIYKPTDLKEKIDYERSKIENICDDMKMAGATDLEIHQEWMMVKNNMKEKYPEYIFDDSKYKELEAMSDTELWLRDIEMEVGLSIEEKKQLLSSYVKDFKNTDFNAKPKAVEKTLKLVNKRK